MDPAAGLPGGWRRARRRRPPCRGRSACSRSSTASTSKLAPRIASSSASPGPSAPSRPGKLLAGRRPRPAARSPCGPDRSRARPARAGVAGDHRLIIARGAGRRVRRRGSSRPGWPRCARCPARRRRRGHPGGIWTIERIASRPARGGETARQRHADHRQVGVGGDGARQGRRDPGAGDDHPQAARAGGLGVFGDQVGLAVGRHHADLVSDAALLELVGGLLHLLHVAVRAHHDADDGAVDVELLELGLDVLFDDGSGTSEMPVEPGRPSCAEGCSGSSFLGSCAGAYVLSRRMGATDLRRDPHRRFRSRSGHGPLTAHVGPTRFRDFPEELHPGRGDTEFG